MDKENQLDEDYYEVTEQDFLDNENEFESPPKSRRWLKVTIASVLSLVLLGNILAFWPYVYTLDAIQFLSKSRELSQREDIQQFKEAVVLINVGDRKGTGFGISPDGYIITNEHVIEGETSVIVKYPGRDTMTASVIMNAPEIDIAVLKINNLNSELPYLHIRSEMKWDVGEPIHFIGNPLFFSGIANEGYVMGLTLLQDWQLPVLALEAPIYRGNSGSPILNVDGEVIAVVFATTKLEIDGTSKKVGLAVPVDYLQSYLPWE